MKIIEKILRLKKILLLIPILTQIEVWAVPTKLKTALIAPEGTTLAKALNNLNTEVKKITKDQVSFKFYFGGVSGDEPDVLRKIHSKQLQGSFFTGKTLGDIESNIRVLELPFNFVKNPAKKSSVVQALSKDFEDSLLKKGFVTLGFYEVGDVYLVSTKRVANLKELQGIKIWFWEGDQLVMSMMKQLGCQVVPLALPDVLSGLSNGIIEASYAPPLAILALQWNKKIKYLVNTPAAYSVGALVITKSEWDKIPKDQQIQIKAISEKISFEANAKAKIDNDMALKQIKQSGVEFIEFPKKEMELTQQIRKKVIDDLVKQKYLSESFIKKLETQLAK